MRYIFNITVSVRTPCGVEQDYMHKLDTLATAMHDVLATKESLLDLCRASEEMIQSTHVECEISQDGEDTLLANAVVDMDATETMQINKPALTKAFKAKVGSLGKLRVEKRLVSVSDLTV
jgi:hypothetical protein